MNVRLAFWIVLVELVQPEAIWPHLLACGLYLPLLRCVLDVILPIM